MKRSPIQRGKGLVRHKRINPVSPKQRKRLHIRYTVTLPAVRERSGGWCELAVPGVCTGRAREGHEPLKRSQGGDITDPNQVLHSCRACNRFVEDFPIAAREMGISVSGHRPVRRAS